MLHPVYYVCQLSVPPEVLCSVHWRHCTD